MIFYLKAILLFSLCSVLMNVGLLFYVLFNRKEFENDITKNNDSKKCFTG